MLNEAYAEQEWFEDAIADEATRKAVAPRTDLRLRPVERARLGARGNVFGSQRVNRLFNAVQAKMFRTGVRPLRDEGQRVTARIRVGEAVDELRKAIREETGADG